MRENTRLRSSRLLKLSGNHYDDQDLLQSFVLFSYSWFFVPTGNTSDLTGDVYTNKCWGRRKAKQPLNQTWSDLPNNFLVSIIYFVAKISYFSTTSMTSRSQYIVSPEKKIKTTVLGKLNSMKYLTCRTWDF